MTDLIKYIRDSVIGDMQLIDTPFGRRPLIYADYTASGRALTFIEDSIRQQVLPFYANTHSESSFTGAHTSTLREQAREEIRRAVNAGTDHKVIFCGSGATAAINKLIDILNLRLPADLTERHRLLKAIPKRQRPVVFIGPYEHHSNELPWRESIVELITIPLDVNGGIDLRMLEIELKAYADRPLKMGSFSAASNVTGIKTDVAAVTELLKKYDAISFWDYAAAAPYVPINMQGTTVAGGHHGKDAVFISPHKFVGGPGTPGILVVHRRLLQNSVPTAPGGGTVLYVTPKDHRYLEDAERSEEGGTPAIVESIRAGMVFKLQQAVGTENIGRREADYVERALERWSSEKNIEILGNTQSPRLSIVSLRIKWKGRDLHYGFVVALLNDLFGIQARGGCSCAGPYGHTLLGIDMAYSRALEQQILNGHKLLRPGWVRLNFNYFISEAVFEYLLEAVALVAQQGWRLLPFYHFDPTAGVWRYQDKKMEPAFSIPQWDFSKVQSKAIDGQYQALHLKDYLEMGKRELSLSKRQAHFYDLKLSEAAEELRWFASPREAVLAL
ncbi:aminotransferase class V-fold PLP-dependent enzyme [Microbulbifer sp. OS29]|uniref:Aminotransferase class V-fold PLP-dependent enzyme n=1 Tax=Microbulbifer okhotskensis TaxID=2926617 RepID=A0A9X2J4T3_9GAMM|nr:aminotransferase class V-fold PLP-dependent enzyme [Microbulbifer okhotskensis]MCO1333644.1 aminotransferase class V-fold PLP-dependent enzyme [Microbulbifer okhotskensis]